MSTRWCQGRYRVDMMRKLGNWIEIIEYDQSSTYLHNNNKIINNIL